MRLVFLASLRLCVKYQNEPFWTVLVHFEPFWYYNGTMPALNLKGIPAKLYSKLRKSARENRRSLNNEAIFRLEQAYGMRKQESPTLRKTKATRATS